MRRLLKLLNGAGWLNVVGMTLALAAIYIISVQVNYEFGYNQKIRDVNRIFMVGIHDANDASTYDIHLSRPVGKRLLDQLPTIENYCVAWGYLVRPEMVVVGEGEAAQNFNVTTLYASTPASQLFGLEVLSGSFDDFGNGNKIAVSEKMAARMGVKVGDALTVAGQDHRRTVAAIYRDLQQNSSLSGAEVFYSDDMDKAEIDNDSEWSFVHFVKLHDVADKEHCEKQAYELMLNIYREQYGVQNISEEQQERLRVTLVPLKTIYFEKGVPYMCMGNKVTTVTLLIMAILILFITMINYINFFLAQVPVKLKSVNTRKILGSSRRSLVFRFMLESGFLVLVSMGLAVVVVLLFKDSSFAQFVTTDISFSKNPLIVGITFISGILLTVVSSVYPALYITSFPPALALKGVMGQSRGGRSFRYILVGFQFCISMVFIICTLFVKKQYDFMMDYDMGFNKENVYTIDQQLDWSNRDLAEELIKTGVIEDVTWGDGSMVRLSRMGWGREFKGKQIFIHCYPVAHNFLQFMGIKVKEGRDFTLSDEQCESGIFIFNPVAQEKFDIQLEDYMYGHNGETGIAGFSENFLFRPLQYGNEPFAFYVFGKHPWRIPSYIYMRAKAGASRAEVQQVVRDFVAKFYPTVNVESLNVRTFDEELGKLYEKEENLVKLITLFSVFAIIISLVGVVGLLMFETAYRRKEIGIRRVNGARVVEILKMFNLQFLRIAFVSFIVAIPVCYLVMDYYLGTFAYRTTLSWWVYVLAFLIICLITVVVVTLCSYRAASENPCKSLKNE